MKFGAVLAFAAGAVVGSVVTSIHLDDSKPAKKETEEKKTEDKDSKNESEYREKTTIDDYTATPQDDITPYDKIIGEYNGASVDPAEEESPEESVEVYENKHRMRAPIEISQIEYNTFGYETQEFYYDPDTGYVWEDGCEPIEEDDRIRMFADLLTDGFDSLDKKVMYIRNFRLMTDFAVYIHSSR